MFLQFDIPDTSRYMVMGYTVSFLVIGLYVLSLYIRTRNLKRDITLLEEMEQPASAGPEAKRAVQESKPVTK